MELRSTSTNTIFWVECIWSWGCLLRNCWRINRLRCAEIGFPLCTTIAASEKSHFTELNRNFQCNPIKRQFERASNRKWPLLRAWKCFHWIFALQEVYIERFLNGPAFGRRFIVANAILIEISEGFSVWRALQPINHIKLHSSTFSPLVHSTSRCNSDSIEINNVPG